MDFIKKFSEHDDYVLYKEGGEMDLPNVSRCDDERDIHLNHNLIKIPLTFRVLSKGEIKWGTTNVENPLTISYKKNTGDWTQITATTDGVFIPVDKGDEVSFKGNNGSYTLVGEATSVNSFMGTTCYFSLYGNIMSLVNGDNFATSFEFPSETDKNFFNFFKGTKCRNAQHLILPATSVPGNGYNCMFYGCVELLTAPELPATTLAGGAYAHMYRNCSTLHQIETVLPALNATSGVYNYMHSNNYQITTAPKIKATTVGQQSCERMFNGCKSLRNVQSVLSATTLGANCYDCMFIGCTSLVTPPALPATTLSNGCYQAMFALCSSLTSAPALSATTVPDDGYNQMFYGCSSLTTSPALPATTIGTNGYYCMFESCTSLTNVPTTLPATNIGENAYIFMFSGCSNMTTAPEIMVENVPKQGCRGMFEYTGITTGPKIHFTTLGENAVRNFVRGCDSLTTAYMSNITSVAKEGAAYFYNASNLVTINNIDGFAPTTVGENGCEQAFSHSPKLTTFPSILPAETLSKACYINMFEGCIAMTKAPVLPARTLLNQSYQAMFWGCTGLQEIECYAVDRSAAACTYAWVQNVPAGGTFKKHPDSTWSTGNSGIPSGWTIVTMTIGEDE